MAPELARARIDALPPKARTDPRTAACATSWPVGLATEERTGPDDDNSDLTCHELVRERICTWMRDDEKGPRQPDGERHPPRLCRAAGGDVRCPSGTRT